MPFAGFSDFNDCLTKQKSKGMSDSSASKICGALQSQTKGAELTEDEIITAVKSAIAYHDCIEKAKSYGHDQESSVRICDQVTEDTENTSKKTKDKGEEDKESKSKKASIDEILDNIDSLLGGAEKKKKKQEPDDEEPLDVADANLKEQNQHTAPDKLKDYNNNNDIDWNSDAEADYNEKSDENKIDLSYYDDDIGKCVEEQVKNGLSQEDSRKFCNNLANSEGATGITDDNDTDSTTETLGATEETKEAYISTAQRDGEGGGDADTPQEYGSDPVDGHRKNRLLVNPHTHDYGTDGPDYNHYGDQPVDEANTSNVDTYKTQQNSTLEGNDHIDTHMDKKHKAMATKHMQHIPKENNALAMRGLGSNSIPPNEDEPADQEAAEDAAQAIAPVGASLSSKINAITGAFKEAISAIIGGAEPHPKVVDNCVKQKMKVDDKLSEEDAKKECNKAFSGSVQKTEDPLINYAKNILDFKWIRNGTTYSAEQCEKDHGSDTDAKSVCEYVASHYAGSYDAYQEDMKIKPFEENNKLFVKAFLLDSSVNLNQWGVSPMTLDKNIKSYIGKPLVLQDNFDHPIAADDSLDHQLQYQELFRVGTITDVVKKDNRYEAISEITDPYAQKAFREGELPLYVSPQLFKMDAAEPDNNMTKWQGTHLAIVKEPAFGVKLAAINGECTGDETTCVSYLKKATIIKEHGYGTCGFCNYKLLSSVRPQIKQASIGTLVGIDASTSPASTVSLTIPTIHTPSVSSLDTNTLNKSVITLENEQAQQVNQQNANVEQLNKENEKLRNSLKIAKESIEEFKKTNEKEKSLNEKLSNRVAAIEMERRKERIASILSGAYKTEELDAKIESFAKSGLPIEEIDAIVTPLKESAKAAVEAKQAETQKVEAAETAAKNASKQVTINKHETKVAMKNAAVEPQEAEVPAWLLTYDHINNKGVA
jgi:hypothetical protein